MIPPQRDRTQSPAPKGGKDKGKGKSKSDKDKGKGARERSQSTIPGVKYCPLWLKTGTCKYQEQNGSCKLPHHNEASLKAAREERAEKVKKLKEAAAKNKG